MPAGLTYVPLASYVVSSNQLYVSFSNLDQGYTDLVLTVSGNCGNSGGDDFVCLSFNGDQDTRFTYQTLYSYSPSSVAVEKTSGSTIMYGPALPISTAPPAYGEMHIMNYSNSSKFKTVLGRWGAVRNGLPSAILAGSWEQQYPIVSVDLRTINGYAFGPGTTFNLYGIAAA
jgi:hypothetical protein